VSDGMRLNGYRLSEYAKQGNYIMGVFRKVINTIFIIPVRIYQYTISPLLPGSCRHIPSCSQYTVEAIKIHGALKGSWMGMRRIARCHPWGTHGYDPVPPRKIKVKK